MERQKQSYLPGTPFLFVTELFPHSFVVVASISARDRPSSGLSRVHWLRNRSSCGIFSFLKHCASLNTYGADLWQKWDQRPPLVQWVLSLSSARTVLAAAHGPPARRSGRSADHSQLRGVSGWLAIASSAE